MSILKKEVILLDYEAVLLFGPVGNVFDTLMSVFITFVVC